MRRVRRIPRGVYPRVGGGNPDNRVIRPRGKGLSPRGRGKRVVDIAQHIGARSIPAWAGETSASKSRSKAKPVYPRVGGGNQKRAPQNLSGSGLSPRGRGKRQASAFSTPTRRSIPAWAGETDPTPHIIPFGAVYPRVGGGNMNSRSSVICSSGLSPRGRGKHTSPPSASPLSRSIPAWAGETYPAQPFAPTPTVYPRVGGGNSRSPKPSANRLGLSPRGRGKRRLSA